MSANHTDGGDEPALMARKFFVLTTLGVVVFMTAATLVVRYMPSNEGVTPSAPTHQQLAAHR